MNIAMCFNNKKSSPVKQVSAITTTTMVNRDLSNYDYTMEKIKILQEIKKRRRISWYYLTIVFFIVGYDKETRFKKVTQS